MSDLISVVISSYKGSDTVERAIRSVLAQTYPSIELIVVDDNGLGGEEQIATEQVVRRYPHVKYIAHQVNKNGSAARNTGIKAASGKYVALLDDDDEFLPAKIEKQYKVMRESGAPVCYTGQKIVFSSGTEREDIPHIQGFIFPQVIQRKVEAPTSVLMFERDVALSIGGFDETFNRHQDWEFLDRLAYKYQIACVPEVCVVRYIIDRNVAKTSKQYIERRIYYLEKQKKLIDTLSKKDRDEVYYYHYAEIMRNAVKTKEYRDAVYWFLKTGKPFRLMSESIKKYLNYRKRL